MGEALPGKPMGRKAYGSIPHIQGSRLGPGDWSLETSATALLTASPRRDDRHVDRVILTEKLDGSCVAVGRVRDAVVPLVRAGYDARSSPHGMHHAFARWVEAREALFRQHLADGERVPGEWLQVAHGTVYDIREDDDLFVPFDVFVPVKGRNLPERRLPHDEQRERLASMGLRGAHVLSDGPAVSVDQALALLGENGFHGAAEPAEGVVYRLETNGAFNFIAKFVRAGKLDGKYIFGEGRDAVLQPTYNGEAALRWAA